MAKLSKENLFHLDWIDDIKHTLDTTGFSGVWDSVQNEDASLTKSIRERLQDIDSQQWHAELSENSLCANYRLIKERHETELYLSKVSDNVRVTLTRFRCGNHDLPVTSSRRKHNMEPCPTCTLCSKAVLETNFIMYLNAHTFWKKRKNISQHTIRLTPIH